MAKEAQITEAAFLKAFNAKAAAAKAAAKKTRPSGMMDSSEIIERLGLEPGQSKSYHGNVSNIKFTFAQKDPKRPMFIFNYSINSEDSNANGLVVPNMITVAERLNKKTNAVIRTEEQAMDDLMYELQGLGEDTASYKNPIADAIAACKKHTKDKTPIRLSIKHWTTDSSEGINVRVNPDIEDNSDLDDSEEEESTDEEEVEEVSAEEDSEEFDSEAWIDGWIDYKYEGDSSIVRCRQQHL
jgi:hypothetical protein